MVYNPNQAGIDDVRIETGNLLPEDYPDSQITKKISSAFSTIQLAVHRKLTEPFDSQDTETEFARELELKIAARDSLKAYGSDFETKVKELDEEVQRDLSFLAGNLQELGTAEEADIMVTTSRLRSYGAVLEEDPNNAVPYTSTNDYVV